MELKNRIATIIRVNNHTAASFADLLGVQRSSISHILNGRNKPSMDFIEKVIINFPRVDPGWLITGKSPENKKLPDMHVNTEPKEIPGSEPDEEKLVSAVLSKDG